MSNKHIRRQHGMSLVELMIAMTLGLLLVAATIQVFLSNSKTYATVGAVTSLQDSARYGVYLLSKDLRTASYAGCVSRGGSTPLTNMLNSSDNVLYNFSRAVEGFDNVGDTPAALTTALTSDPKPLAGTDILIVRGPTDAPFKVRQTNSSSEVFTEVDSVESGTCSGDSERVNGVCPGDFLLLSDCAKARIFQAGDLTISDAAPDQLVIAHPSTGSPGNSVSSWGSTYADRFGLGSEVTRISTLVYYIANNPDSGVPALYRKDGNAAATLIVDGVKDMQISYGVETSGDFETDSYIAAGLVTNWDRVLAVRINLHMISLDDNVIDSAQTFTYNGTSVTATDKRLHYAFGTTIALRNRVP